MTLSEPEERAFREIELGLLRDFPAMEKVLAPAPRSVRYPFVRTLMTCLLAVCSAYVVLAVVAMTDIGLPVGFAVLSGMLACLAAAQWRRPRRRFRGV